MALKTLTTLAAVKKLLDDKSTTLSDVQRDAVANQMMTLISADLEIQQSWLEGVLKNPSIGDQNDSNAKQIAGDVKKALTVPPAKSKSRRRPSKWLIGGLAAALLVAFGWYSWPWFENDDAGDEDEVVALYDSTARGMAKGADVRSKANRRAIGSLNGKVDALAINGTGALAASEFCPGGSLGACVRETMDDELNNGGRELISQGLVSRQEVEVDVTESCRRLCGGEAPVARRPAPKAAAGKKKSRKRADKSKKKGADAGPSAEELL